MINAGVHVRTLSPMAHVSRDTLCRIQFFICDYGK